MAYQITYRERAAKEYLSSLLWYKQRSYTAAVNFVKAIDEMVLRISNDPTRYRNTYRNFHEIIVHTFPFSIIYFIDENLNSVVIVSIFHHKRNPRKKFTDS
ncbi:MAG: hypothetical protein C0459_02120 [Chitinophaga sp.]|jgi:plasmid stabilization system protein ParE|nr:hypothetical protein [Chitinophaga sp.]